VNEIVCRTLKIEVLPYAQYPQALKVTYLLKGKRNLRQFWISCYPFLVVIPTVKALGLSPENWEAPDTTTTPGMRVTKMKYGSCDPRFVTDWMAKLAASGVEPLVNVCNVQ